MQHTTTRKILSFLLLLAMLASLFAGLTMTANAAQPTSASEVNYKKSGSYVYNWGKRDTDATFLTTYAQNYYTGSYSYATLSAKSGNSGTGTAFVSSELGTAIHNMLAAKQSYTTSYDATRPLYQYTDCEENGNKISSFYSGNLVGPDWDSGATWNREHIWPQSKTLGGSSNSDLMMIRPTSVSENSSRGNNAFGTGSGYYDPNKLGNNLRGDVARITLQHLMRWGTSSSTFYGTGGVMESRAILLQWMEEDPVDTWEMGRNDSMQSILGVRNVFVDYPELAFKLLGASVPANYPTPSNGGTTTSYTVTATTNSSNYGTVSVSGYTITASPKTGYYAQGYTVTSGTASVVQNGNTFTVSPTSNCTVRINFAAKQSVTVTLNNNGSTSTKTGYAGEAMALTMPTAPSGYTAVGWVGSSVSDSTTKPATIYTTSYTPTGNCTLYALFSHVVGGGGGSSTQFEKYSGTISEGNYLITYQNYAMKAEMLDKRIGFSAVSPVSDVVSNPAANLIWHIAPSGSYWTIFNSSTSKYAASSGVKNNAALGTSGTDDKSLWTVTGSSTYEFENKYNKANSINALLRKNDTYGFATYSSSTGGALTLYKAGAGGTTYYTTSTGPACNHSYTSVVTAATCTAGGYTTYTCSKCGDTYTGNEIDALGHNYGSFSHNASSSPSTHSKTCSRCHDVVTENCSFTNTTVGTTVTHTCSVCQYRYQSTLQTFTVSFCVPTGVSSIESMEVAEGTPMTLPTAGRVDGYTFAGWVTAPINSEVTAAPTVLTGSYTPTASITLYALYTRTEAGGSGSSNEFTKVTSAPSDWSGDYLIVWEASATDARVFNGTSATEKFATGTISNNKITKSGDMAVVTIEKITDGYSLYVDGKGYMKGTSGTNALSYATSAQLNTIEMNNEGVLITSNTSVLRWNNGSSNGHLFRYYKFDTYSNQQPIQLYKAGAGSTTYYTTNPTGHVHNYDSTGVCSCGDKLISIDSASLRLDEDIDVIYAATVPSGATNVKMTFTMNGASTEVSDDGSHSFIFEGVNPQCMGDNISAALSVTYGGKNYSCTKANYSVKTYCVDQLAKSGISASLKKLLSDTLAYGAAAQTYMNYKTSSLVTSGVTGTSYSTFPGLSGLAPTFTGTAADSPYWTGACLTLTNNVEMVFRFASPNKTGLSVKVTYNGKTTTFSGTSITAVSGMSGVYEVKLTGIKATDFGQTVTAKFYKNSAQIGNTLNYSVNTYICAKQNDSNTLLKNLVRALYNYGASAAAYAANP